MNRDADIADQFESFRGHLARLAEERIGPRLRGKVDPDDLVQQVFGQACRHREGFGGGPRAQVRAWLRAILANVLVDHLRKFAEPVGERAIDAVGEGSTRAPGPPPADRGSTPSHKASRKERDAFLALALARLPEDQRRAVELRHLRGKSPEEVADLMGRTVPAVAGLLRRGLLALRAELDFLD